MYMLANSSNSAISKSSSWRQRRPDLNLTLVKSASWSFLAGSSLDPTYPSPPMSNSPVSPIKSSQFVEEAPAGNLVDRASSVPAEQRIQIRPGTSMDGSTMAMPAPIRQQQPRFGLQPGSYLEPRLELQPRPIVSHPSYGRQDRTDFASVVDVSAAPFLSVQGSFGQLPMGNYQGPISMVRAPNPRIARTSRRAKPHVARACQNCKKAHLSCDEGRPCARCVASGKQATCVDVEHKKRGRPRLRDDREQRLEQAAVAAIVAQSTPSSQPSQSSSTRGSIDGTSQMSMPAPIPQSLTGRLAPSGGFGFYPPPPPDLPRAPASPVTAFLNMDLRILKASDAFRALLADGGDVRGRDFSEFSSSQHGPSLQRLQRDLRDERTRREPTFLPGIFPEEQEQNAVQDYDVEDVETISHGFDTRHDSFTFILPNGRTEQIQIKIRLARTTTFFITVMLYRLSPQAPLARSAFARRQSHDLLSLLTPNPSPTHSTFHPTGPISPFTASTPGSPFSTFHASLMTSLPPAASTNPATLSNAQVGVRTDQSYFSRGPSNLAPNTGMYPPPPPGLPRSHSISDSRLHIAPERRRPELLSGNLQLPPITSSLPATPVTSQLLDPLDLGSARRRTHPTTEEEEENARKRRRLDIKEILSD